MATISARQQQRRRTAAQLFSENPTLSAGELVFASDTGLVKIGPGNYGSLPFVSPMLDIRSFGATASSARAGIQAALDHAFAMASLGQPLTVMVPPGTWQIDADVIVPNNVTLRGAGDTSILRMDNGTSAGGGAVLQLGVDITTTLVENITIENLVVDGNQAGQDTSNRRHCIAANIQAGTLRGLRLRNLILRNAGHYGIGLQGNGFYGENIWIENVEIENVRGDGIDIKSQGTRNCHIRNIGISYFGTDAAFPAQSGIDLRGTWTVEGVDIRSVANDVNTDNAAIRFRQSGGTAPQVPPTRAGAVGCVVRGVTVALTGSVEANKVSTGTGAGSNNHIAVGNEIDTIALRRAQVVALTEGGAGDQTSHLTATVTPRPNVLLLLAVANSHATNATTPTISGCGLTWTLVRSRAHNAGNRLSLFSAMGYSHTPPTSGQITIDFGASAQTAIWRLDAIENVSLLSAADAVVQSADNTVSSGAALAVTLAAFNHTLNSTYATFVTWNSTTLPDTESGYHRAENAAAVGSRRLMAVWRPDTDTTPGVTHASATMTGIAVELRVARP